MRAVTIADIAAPEPRSIAIGPFGSALRADRYTSSGVPVVRGQNIGERWGLSIDDVVYVSRETADEFPACVVRPGDLVFPHRGAIGRVARVDDQEWLLSSSMMKLTVDPDVADSRFVLLYFRDKGRDELLNRASTVGTPGIGQPLTSLRSIPIPLPPLPDQQAIAEVLGALDDKIAANTALVSQLEQISRTLILSTPTTEVALGDIVEFHNRRRVPLSASQREARPGAVPYYGANGQMATVDEPIFDEPLVLLGEDGSVVREDGSPFVRYIWGPAWVNNHAHVLTGLGVSTELLSVLLVTARVDTLVTGAVQPKLSMGNAKRIRLRVPEAACLADLDRQVSALIASQRCLADQNRTLAATRDALLPQLMSGKLRVRDAVRVVEGEV